VIYKGYEGKVKFDEKAGGFHGDVINTRDVITFKGTSAETLEQAFRDSVDEYLAFCASRGEEPEKPIAYPALFEPDVESGGFVVTFPDLNHGATQGETEQEAMEMARDFLACVLSDYAKRGWSLPAPGKYSGEKYRMVQLPR
jgi:predicted RNase H-like HicB family nuclease